jgi:hypothetical protein
MRKPKAASLTGRTIDRARKDAANADIATPATSTAKRRKTREFAVSSSSLEGRLNPSVQSDEVETFLK